MGHQILSEFGRLLLFRPGLHSPPPVIAAWYLRKAALFELIATDGGQDADDARREAEKARTHALRLMKDHGA